MAPWPELENAQHNTSQYIEGATSQQSTTAAKEKETDKSKCRSRSRRLALRGDPRRLRLGSSFLLASALCLGR